VIIVDIRAMDTTGEITVLVVVGLCIFGLLRARRARA
jgi:multisubunit Na+/H+ antiporter MnhB subunit